MCVYIYIYIHLFKKKTRLVIAARPSLKQTQTQIDLSQIPRWVIAATHTTTAATTVMFQPQRI